jgi:magnesium transporter
MQRTLLEANAQHSLHWIDITEPTPEQLHALAEQYGLHPLTVQDCLQSDHLPKFEVTESGEAFIILRAFDFDFKGTPDNLQDISNKIAIFTGPDYIITLHRKEYAFLDTIVDRLQEWGRKNLKSWSTQQVIGYIFREVYIQYREPARKLEQEIDYYESNIFLRKGNRDLLKSLYLIKRKALLFKRIIMLLREPLMQFKIHTGNKHGRLMQDITDRQLELEISYDQMLDELSQLLNLYISLSSQRTNEVMRILTIFSVFFLPLTFIVGVYGMNFKIMPELDWKYGYALVWGIMIIVTLMVFFWFKKRKWL